MILLDSNLLIYARGVEFEWHEAAREWLDETLRGPGRVGIPWPSVLSFLRVVTHPRIMQRPESLPQAWRQVETWLAVPSVWIPAPGDQHAAVVAQLLPYAAPGGNLVADLHLAALAIEHGLTLCSADRDFARFPDLRWRNPLIPPPPPRKRHR